MYEVSWIYLILFYSYGPGFKNPTKDGRGDDTCSRRN